MLKQDPQTPKPEDWDEAFWEEIVRQH